MNNNHINDNLFADLFAYRFALLDIYPDNEQYIIMKLKIKLLSLGHNRTRINHIIYDFYQYYMIPITEIEIENTNIYPNLLFSTLMNIIENNNNDDNNETEETEVLTEEEFNRLEKSNVTEVDMECSICIETFTMGQPAIKLPCNHFFHHNCIKVHLTTYNNKCPLCRGNVINQ